MSAFIAKARVDTLPRMTQTWFIVIAITISISISKG